VVIETLLRREAFHQPRAGYSSVCLPLAMELMWRRLPRSLGLQERTNKIAGTLDTETSIAASAIPAAAKR